MGLDRIIRFPVDETPSWDSIRLYLTRLGESPTLRLIDGLPAFPDESPAAGWQELRVATSGGMVTLRRSAGTLTCVVWGNADAALTKAWEKVIWACAAAGNGMIDGPEGPATADAFARSSSFALE